MTTTMLRHFRKFWFLAILAFFTLIAAALSPLSARADDSSDQDRYAAFAGMDYGYAAEGSVAPGESLKRGYQLDFKGSLTRYWPEWAGDIGLGWFFNRISNGGDVNTMVRLTTTALFLDLSGRYRINQNWQIGPALNILVGNSNVTFSESMNNENSLSLLGGLRGVYEFRFSPVQVRATAQVMTDLTIANRQLWWFQVGAQIGLPVKLPIDF